MAKTTLKLQDILQDLKDTGSSGLEKTAETRGNPAAVTSARNELVNALNGAMTKTASAPTPRQGDPAVNQVMKIAGDLAASEQEALKKEASFFGAAFMDGALARLHQYETATGTVKTATVASAPLSQEAEFEKFAAENPELVKEAIQLGYLHGKQQIAQIKQAAVAEQNGGQVKQAAFQQGYADAAGQIQELQKTAETRGNPAAVTSARNELVNALNGAMTKTASAPAPRQGDPAVNQVMKIAGDLAASEQEALKKEASFFGAAFMDGALARLHQYETATGTVKTASVASAPLSQEAEFEKFAAENPELVKEAIQLGYLHGKQQIAQIKQAAVAEQNDGQVKQAAFQQGYADAAGQIQELQKTAEGRQVLQQIASGAQGQGQGQTKTAEEAQLIKAAQAGYQDTMAELTKLSSDVFNNGYQDTVRILRSM